MRDILQVHGAGFQSQPSKKVGLPSPWIKGTLRMAAVRDSRRRKLSMINMLILWGSFSTVMASFQYIWSLENIHNNNYFVVLFGVESYSDVTNV